MSLDVGAIIDGIESQIVEHGGATYIGLFGEYVSLSKPWIRVLNRVL